MFTIFTTCRPFRDEFGVIQRQALESWARLKPKPQIITIGDEPGSDAMARKFGGVHVPAVTRNRWGTPLLSALFWTAKEVAAHDTLVYCNADVILLPEFGPAVEEAAAWAGERDEPFLMTGARWDMAEGYPINFKKDDWAQTLRYDMHILGKRHKPTGLDYFVHDRQTYAPSKWPPLAVGRTSWDAWLLWRARANGLPVIDATAAVTVVHQAHPKGKPDGDEIKANRKRAEEDRFGRGYLWEADWQMTPELEVRPAPSVADWWSEGAGWTGWKG